MPLVIGQKVWLLRRHITTTRPSSKLDVRKLGPFPIIGQVGSSAYRLGLPSSIKIYHVFHVSLLDPHVANTFQGRVVGIPPPIQVDGVPEFEVRSWIREFGAANFRTSWIGWATMHLTVRGSRQMH